MWQDSLIHAREWVTGATLMWVANKLVQEYRNGNHEIVSFLEDLDWLILPVWNVDGYRHTWTKVYNVVCILIIYFFIYT